MTACLRDFATRWPCTCLSHHCPNAWPSVGRVLMVINVVTCALQGIIQATSSSKRDTFTNHLARRDETGRGRKKHKTKGGPCNVTSWSSCSRQVLVLRRRVLVFLLEQPVHLLDHPSGPSGFVSAAAASDPGALSAGSLHKFDQMVSQQVDRFGIHVRMCDKRW
jgi:hypothetical protein